MTDNFDTLPAEGFGIYRGDSWGHTWVIAESYTANPEDPENPTIEPFDLTGYTVRSEMRPGFSVDAMTPVTEVSCVVDDDPTTGRVAVSLTPAQTAAMRAAFRVAWDIELSKDGLVWTPLRAWVPVSGDVTKEVTP